jgi:hypothetical protein
MVGRFADGSFVVDEIEDGRFPSFHKVQQPSTRSTHLIETKHFENRAFSGRPETALGTVDRFPLCGLFSATYKIDHLSKRQVAASSGADQH